MWEWWDSVARKSVIVGLEDILFSDTVGFISNLPPNLIESFKATLDELKAADLLLHVVDISDPNYIFKINQVSKILEELQISHITQIKVNNKSDKARIKDFSKLSNLKKREVWISAENQIGITGLKDTINFHCKKEIKKKWIKIDSSQGKIRSKLYSQGRVIEERTTVSGLIQLHIEIERNELDHLLSLKGIKLDKTDIKEAV